jgi:hypothetical protein
MKFRYVNDGKEKRESHEFHFSTEILLEGIQIDISVYGMGASKIEAATQFLGRLKELQKEVFKDTEFINMLCINDLLEIQEQN